MMETASADFDVAVKNVKSGNIVSNLLRSKLEDQPETISCATDDDDSGLFICYEPVEQFRHQEGLITESFHLMENFFQSHPELLNEVTKEVPHERPTTKIYKTYLRKCRICQRAFTKQKDLDEHKELHFEMDRAFRCKTCRKLFFDMRNLKNHEKIHVKENSKCKICLKEFRFEKYLAQHIKQHQEVASLDVIDDSSDLSNDSNSDEEDESEATYSCQHCGKYFSSESKLMTHSNMHFSYKPYKCKKCPKAFSKEINLRSHLVTHLDTSSFPCKHCGKVFVTRMKLDDHRRIHYR